MTIIAPHTTRATGTILTAAVYNADHNNHVTNASNLNADKLESSGIITPGNIAVFVDDVTIEDGGIASTDIGTGDVVGPASSTNDNLARFGDTTGKLIEDAGVSVTTVGAGKQTIWIPAGAMIRRTTNPPAALATIELATNDVMLQSLNFDATTVEGAQFRVAMPKGWDEGTFTFQAVWSHAATVTNFGVAWGLSARALSNDDAQDQAFGTEVVVADTGGTTDDLYIADESAAVTAAGTPAEGDIVVFLVTRVTGNGGDTMTIDARLEGIKLYYTTNANTDA